MRKFIMSFSRGIITLLIIGIALIGMSHEAGFAALKKPVDFDYLLDNKPETGMHVKGDVMYIYDCFASEETYTERRDGSRSGSKLTSEYYILPAEGEYPFVVLQAPADDSGWLGKIIDETWEYLEYGTEPKTKVAVDGYIVKAEKDLKKLLDDYLLDVWEYTEAELAGADILVIKQPGGSMTTSLCFLLGGFLAIIGAVVWYVINLKREFKYENKECDI